MLGHHLAYVGNENDTALTERSRVLQTQRRFKQTTSLENRLSDFLNGEGAEAEGTGSKELDELLRMVR
jgi:hypothetical protein